MSARSPDSLNLTGGGITTNNVVVVVFKSEFVVVLLLPHLSNRCAAVSEVWGNLDLENVCCACVSFSFPFLIPV